jgi:hypothetical protein
MIKLLLMKVTRSVEFRFAIALAAFMMLHKFSWAQLNGNYNIPGDYPSLQDAINDLNAQGVSGTVNLNVLPGNPQKAPQGGFVIGGTGSNIITGAYATGNAKQVYIYGNGNVVTADSLQGTGLLTDAVFKLIGADFITIENFIIEENPFNTITASASNNMTEWGIALLCVTNTDGCKNNTIQGNTITLSRTYQNSFGIYSNVNHSATNVSTFSPVTSIGGSNSDLHIYSNQISNVNTGIAIIGDIFFYSDKGLQIGWSMSTGNIITDFGYSSSISSFSYLPHEVCGIVAGNQLNCNISYNTITSSAGGTLSGNLYGIYSKYNVGGLSLGSNYIYINSNSIALKSGNATGDITGIENETGNDNTALQMNSNNAHQLEYSSAGSGIVNAIVNTADTYTQEFKNNIFSNLVINTGGNVNLMLLSGVPGIIYGSKLVHRNSIVGSLNKSIGGGNMSCISESYAMLMDDYTSTTIDSNDFSNVIIPASTYFVGFACGQQYSTIHLASCNLTANIIQNVTGGAGSYYGISSYGYKIENNIVRNFSTSGGVTGIRCSGKDVVTLNTVSDISGDAAATVTGIYCNEPDGMKITRNKIYTLTNISVDGIVFGIQIYSSNPVADIYVNNNLIGDLQAPHSTHNNAICGIELGNSFGNSNLTAWIYYNSILLNATSTSNSVFSVNNIYSLSGIVQPPHLNVYNNILVNTSTPGPSGGFNTAIKYWSFSPGNHYSNNNCYYTGTPAPNQLIFGSGDGNNPSPGFENLSDFANYLSNGSEYNSITENPPFLSTVGSSPQFLHIDSTVVTGIESGGKYFSGYNVDYDNEKRWGAPGYAGYGLAPDIGADETWNLPLEIKSNSSSSGYSIYPNPADKHITILSGKNSGPMQIKISDPKGKIIFTSPSTDSNQVVIDTHDFAAGVYFVMILSEKNVQTEKIIIAKN